MYKHAWGSHGKITAQVYGKCSVIHFYRHSSGKIRDKKNGYGTRRQAEKEFNKLKSAYEKKGDRNRLILITCVVDGKSEVLEQWGDKSIVKRFYDQEESDRMKKSNKKVAKKNPSRNPSNPELSSLIEDIGDGLKFKSSGGASARKGFVDLSKKYASQDGFDEDVVVRSFLVYRLVRSKYSVLGSLRKTKYSKKKDIEKSIISISKLISQGADKKKLTLAAYIASRQAADAAWASAREAPRRSSRDAAWAAYAAADAANAAADIADTDAARSHSLDASESAWAADDGAWREYTSPNNADDTAHTSPYGSMVVDLAKSLLNIMKKESDRAKRNANPKSMTANKKVAKKNPSELEGPFTFPNGRVVYYDPGEGKYYDRGTDLYLSESEVESMQSKSKKKAKKNPIKVESFDADGYAKRAKGMSDDQMLNAMMSLHKRVMVDGQRLGPVEKEKLLILSQEACDRGNKCLGNKPTKLPSSKRNPKKNPSRQAGGFYIVDTRVGKVVAGPYSVREADMTLEESAGFDHATHQVMDGRYLTDLAFKAKKKNPTKKKVSKKKASWSASDIKGMQEFHDRKTGVKKKSTKKKSTRKKTPEWQLLCNRCAKLWDHYCERPSKARLKPVLAHLEKMKGSTSKRVADERKACLRVANKEARRLKMK